MSDLNRLRATLSVMRNDFLNGFNYRDLNIYLYNQAQKERVAGYNNRMKEWIAKKNKDENRNPPLTEANLTPQDKTEMTKALGPKPEPKPPRVERVVTNFIGDQQKVYFTTSSGFRLRKDNRVSELMEVGYYIKTCRSRRQVGQNYDCLWRSISYNLDGDVTQDNEGTVLIENVKDIQFSYLGASQTEGELNWSESWDSTQTGDQRYGEMFPEGVKVKLTVDFVKSKKDDSKKKTRSITGYFPIAFTNNKPFQRIRFPELAPAATGDGATPPTTSPTGGTP